MKYLASAFFGIAMCLAFSSGFFSGTERIITGGLAITFGMAGLTFGVIYVPKIREEWDDIVTKIKHGAEE